jgi:hypothetical protein
VCHPKPLLRISPEISLLGESNPISAPHTQPASSLTLTTDLNLTLGRTPDVSHGAFTFDPYLTQPTTHIHTRIHMHADCSRPTQPQTVSRSSPTQPYTTPTNETSTSILRHLHYMPFCELRLLTLCSLHSPARPIRIRQEQRQIENGLHKRPPKQITWGFPARNR